jgi:glycosyltransferase involved in cell wall biosynthesis
MMRALTNLGMVQQSHADYNSAMLTYTDALRLYPHQPDAVIKTAMLLEKLDCKREAIRLYEEGIRNVPCLEFYVNLGALLVSTGMTELAVAPLRKAIDLSPDCIVAYINLATAYHNLGNNLEAIANLRKAFELEPTNSEVIKRLSKLLGVLSPLPRRIAAAAESAPKIHNFVQVISSFDYTSQFNPQANTEPTKLPENLLIYDGNCDVSASVPKQNKCDIAFVSPHCVLDFTNGAATATLDGLKLLGSSGFGCQAFCGTRYGAREESSIEATLAKRGDAFVTRNSQLGPFKGRMIFSSHGEMPVTLVDTSPIKHPQAKDQRFDREEIAAFITGCAIFLVKSCPDVLWTYGGDPLSLVVQQIAKQRGIPVVFALHNFSYTDAAPFKMADFIVVPTDFACQHYADKLGLETAVLPPALDPERVSIIKPVAQQKTNAAESGESSIRHVTFVNPSLLKGVAVFARIAEVLARRRPDIPVLLVEGSRKASFLASLGIDIQALKNVRIMPNTPDARQFLAATKLLLVPSLLENAAMVAREAMFNGIPVLASNRGGLPETIGDAGFLLDIPARYTPETRDLPTAEEIELWIETIIRLWDDAAEYELRSRAAFDHAQQWHPDQLAPIYLDFFSNITHRCSQSFVQ